MHDSILGHHPLDIPLDSPPTRTISLPDKKSGPWTEPSNGIGIGKAAIAANYANRPIATAYHVKVGYIVILRRTFIAT